MQFAYESERYLATTPEQLRANVERFGVAVVPRVLDDDECEDMAHGVWDFFEKITQRWEAPMRRADPESWKGLWDLYPLHSMLVQHWGVGHAQVAWDLRQNPKIADVFAGFWATHREDLVVSFDALALSPPPETTRRGWFRGNLWLHCDQSYKRNEFEMLQSWVTAHDVGEGDATLALLEGSHALHAEARAALELDGKAEWHKLDERETQFYLDRGCAPRKVSCPKGSLVLWDGRLVHCGTEAMFGRANARERAVAYLCYVPRALLTEANLRKKRELFEAGRTTTHNPGVGPRKPNPFGKTPRTYGKTLPEVVPPPRPALTPLGERLAGF